MLKGRITLSGSSQAVTLEEIKHAYFGDRLP
jgi:hypothetical protein